MKPFHESVKFLSKPLGIPDQTWDLFAAAAVGNLDVIEAILDDHQELVHVQIWYEFPLHFAVKGNHPKVVERLLERGTNPAFSHFCYSSWQKLLPLAQKRGFDQVAQLLESEMKNRFNFDRGYEKILNAIRTHAGPIRIQKLIEQRPESIHFGDEHGNRPLHFAVVARQLAVIEKLLELGADIHAERADHQTPLHLAVVGTDYWFSRDLMDDSVDPKEIARMLIHNGATFEFSAAVALGDLQTVELQLNENPDLAKQLDKSRYSPLSFAAQNGHYDLVKLLLESGAEPDLPEHCCEKNGAALFAACARNDVPMVELLLSHGANPNGESDSSGSCLTISRYRENENTPIVQELLRQQGALDPLWEVDSPEQLFKWLRGGLCERDFPFWGSVVQKVIELSDDKILDEFVSRFGMEPIRNLDHANGWHLVDNAEFLDRLIGMGMNVNRPDWLGQSCLHGLVECNAEPNTLKLYLDRGADKSVVDFTSGKTAYELAIEKENHELAKLLLE